LSGLDLEADAVHGDEIAVALGELSRFYHVEFAVMVSLQSAAAPQTCDGFE